MIEIKNNILAFCLLFLVYGCDSNKRYEDYNENDFYEVQGIITNVTPTSDPYDSSRRRNIYYDYHLDFNPPLKDGEKNIDLVLKVGDPIVVLVHKSDKKISFYGRFGIIDERLNIGLPINNDTIQ